MALSAKIERVDVVEGGAADGAMASVKARFSQFSTAQHAEYTILVSLGGESYQIRKRFSEFAAFHERLKNRFGVMNFDLPAKTPIRYFNPDKLEDRKNGLNVYLKELCSRRDMCDSQEVRSFFSKAGGGLVSPNSSHPIESNNTRGGHQSSAYVPRSQPANKIAGNRHDEEDDLIGWDN
mmetsp:Transcript_83437/g.131806  ORF Transcript_83437/g.131806 Transcript_83437/m.131806 type:complete len:179 (+) Transcript_83437:73-609(+)|eukprot:CAMPEP_0169119456 /NCGR_PEP_ID=MMETSP1015-20121227/31570_1 /TAXON_ID=342587 /ORGANISM="Karlodinium micrum, Strain CCMP2283" /LENGTH=178 /DNA_ID=CAMNT_0009182345 /DNA_START=71 /DNA_END=607 /DNA_ORIENTATION=-